MTIIEHDGPHHFGLTITQVETQAAEDRRSHAVELSGVKAAVVASRLEARREREQLQVTAFPCLCTALAFHCLSLAVHCLSLPGGARGGGCCP